MNIASNNTVRLVNLINDILDLEKIKAGKMEFKFDKCEVMSLVKETIEFNDEYAKIYNVKYELTGNLENTFINVDKDKFIQVLTNLLSNAAKFPLENEIVKIHLNKNNGFVSVSVTNKGYGIPEKSYSKIFESFSQIDQSDTRKKGGTGLGLSICKSLVEKMGGSIGFISKLNEETTFYFKFPEVIKSSDKNVVLVCEDNKTAAFGVKLMLEKLGYKVDIAYSAGETKQLLKNNSYDLMTLDIILPDEDGLVLLKELRTSDKTKNMPVIIISAKKQDSELENIDDKVIGWLEKSFDIENLEQTINKIMNENDKHKVRILHIENDEDILNLMEMTLKDIASITKAKTLAIARDIIPKSTFDLIILDYIFPDDTSDKLIPLIKSGSNKNAKIVTFSSYEESKILSRYVDDILIKTNVSFDDFKKYIEKFIAIKNKQEK